MIQLTISGNGPMDDYISNTSTPWKKYTDNILGITVADGITRIGNNAFAKCGLALTFNIADSVTEIGDNAFERCLFLKTMPQPKNLTSIGKEAFSYTAITEINLPSTVTSLGSGAFKYCTKATKATISANITTIPSRAFEACAALSEISIPEGITDIDMMAFQNCMGLTKVTLPVSLKKISTDAFIADQAIKDVYYDESPAKWADILISSGNDSIKTATIHFSVDVDPYDFILPIGRKVNSWVVYFRNVVTKANHSFRSSDTSIATVDRQGNITPKKPGKVTIECYGPQVNTASHEFVILSKPKLKFEKPMTYTGQTVSATNCFTTEDTAQAKVTLWESSKTSVAEIDSETGIITAKNSGTAKITAYFGKKGEKGTLKVTAKLTVKIPKFAKTEYTIKTGQKKKIAMKNVNALTGPAWSTEGKYVEVGDDINNKGVKTGKVVVKGVNSGSEEIVATIDGQEYRTKIIVTAPQIKKATASVKVGKTMTVGLKNTAYKASEIKWETDSPETVSIGLNGKITGLKTGTAKVFTNTGGVLNECIVTVK